MRLNIIYLLQQYPLIDIIKMTTNLLLHNPYRILGVYSNSPKKDMLSNLNKMKAFLKVGKDVAFPLDLPALLPPVHRDEKEVTEAQTAIELPIDQIKHSLFWFIKVTPLDEVAFNHLISGNISQAKEIWSKKESVSSLVNLMSCALIEEDWRSLAINADTLFQRYSNEFCSTVNETVKLSTMQLTELFVAQLKEDGKIDLSLLAQVPETSSEWKKILGSSLVKPIIDEITHAINEAKGVKGSSANYNAGVKLMNATKNSLAKLKNLVGGSDMQYQMVADKLATTILQCGINYFNETEDDDAPQKAMTLQGYALSIAVGQIVKDRCKENVDVLKKIGPEYAIRNEMDAIGKLLKNFNNPSSIYSGSSIFDSYGSSSLFGIKKSKYSELDILNLINSARPELNKIKAKLGSNADTYLKISSAVASAAINALVDIINKEQESVSIYGTSAALMLRPKIESAVQTMSVIGTLDMTSQCRTYYNNNNNTLNSISRQLQPKPSSSGGCYIATMAYGDYDHPQVMVLRNFRDSYLAKRDWGRKFIAYYYRHSPGWVDKLRNHRYINVAIRNVLDTFVAFWKKSSYYETYMNGFRQRE